MSWLSECCECTNVSNIAFEENGKSAVFRNTARLCHVKTQIDNCLITKGVRADGMLSKPGVGDVIVELKGKDINHAAEQVLKTAEFCTRSKMRCGKLAGLIVGSEFPRTNTVVQKAKEKFARSYGGPLHVVTKNGHFEIDHVLSFKGPFKK